jgi:GNAT superfamily N-acetyltransferase
MNGSAPFRVRAAMAADVPLLARHRVEMFRDMGRMSAEDDGAELRAASETMLGEWIDAGSYHGWLAEPVARPGLVVGGAGVQLRPMLPRPSRDGKSLVTGPEAYVLNVFVERAWRRRGVATHLMQHVLGYTRERRMRMVTLHASAEGRALYERLGFESTTEMRLV